MDRKSNSKPREKKYSLDVFGMTIDEIVRLALAEGTSYGKYVHKHGGVKPKKRRKDHE